MNIDRQLILKLEDLAKLELSETERLQLMEDLNKILGMVEKMEELDTTDVEPLVYILEETIKLRDDEIKGQVLQQLALSNAPDKDGEHFRVPKVL